MNKTTVMRAFLDASVLYPALLRNLLMRLALVSGYERRMEGLSLLDAMIATSLPLPLRRRDRDFYRILDQLCRSLPNSISIDANVGAPIKGEETHPSQRPPASR